MSEEAFNSTHGPKFAVVVLLIGIRLLISRQSPEPFKVYGAIFALEKSMDFSKKKKKKFLRKLFEYYIPTCHKKTR